MADVLDEHAEELAQLESLNVGKALLASRNEMPFSADNMSAYSLEEYTQVKHVAIKLAGA